MHMNKVILAGGFQEIIELCELCNYEIVGIADKICQDGPYPYLGTDEDLIKNADKFCDISIILTPDKPAVRRYLAARYKAAGFRLASLISPKAFIAPSAKIGEGCIIQSFCNVSSETILKEGVRLNTYANVMHNGILENYVTIAPNAVLLGACKVDECGYIGANSTLLPGVHIGAEAIVGAGAVVTKNVLPRTTVVGIPAKCMKK